MNITCCRCKKRSPQISTTSSVTQYRCSCGYVTLIERTKPALAQMTGQNYDQGQQQHGRCQQQHGRWRLAFNWFKGSSPSLWSSDNYKSVSPSSSTSLIRNSCGGKRALLCGVTYKHRKYQIQGSRNAVISMKDLLINTFRFPADCVRILADNEQSMDRIPTKKNIEKSLKWLVEGCQAGDSLVFYFAGHGLRQPDFKDDEIDGFDETICPLDFMEEGMILDNDINSTIVHPLMKGVTLHAIVDACHSATILDLLCVYDLKENTWKDNSPPSGAKKCTSGGLAICISLCGDDEKVADTSAFNRNVMNGALTYILIETIKNNSGGITYGVLLESMLYQITKFNGESCLNSKFARKVCRNKIIQEPLLSSSEEFDVYAWKFIL